MKCISVRAHHFARRLDKFRLQLRYSLMALLSENRVSLFNPGIITLMDSLLAKRWNDSDTAASFASFLLDKMHFQLDAKREPYQDLCALFHQLRSDRENDAEF